MVVKGCQLSDRKNIILACPVFKYSGALYKKSKFACLIKIRQKSNQFKC